MITHQDIIDRLETLGNEYSAAYRAEQARQEKERDSIKELCGGLGHFFAKDRSTFGIRRNARVCVYCNASEPSKNGSAQS